MKNNKLLYILIWLSGLSLVISLYSLFKDIDIEFDKHISFISKNEESYNTWSRNDNNVWTWLDIQETLSEQEKAINKSNKQFNNYTNKVSENIQKKYWVDVIELQKEKQDSFDKLLEKYNIEKLYHDFKSMLSNEKYQETIYNIVLNPDDLEDINNIQELLYRSVQKDYSDITYNISIDKFINILNDDYMLSYIKSLKEEKKYTLPWWIVVDKEMKEMVESEIEEYINTYPWSTKQQAAETLLRTFIMERESWTWSIQDSWYHNNDPFGQYDIWPWEYEEAF